MEHLQGNSGCHVSNYDDDCEDDDDGNNEDDDDDGNYGTFTSQQPLPCEHNL